MKARIAVVEKCSGGPCSHVLWGVWGDRRESVACRGRGAGGRKVEPARLTPWGGSGRRTLPHRFYEGRMKALTCAHGSPWPCGPCAGCLAESEWLIARFRDEVTAGVYDREGYTPAERRAWMRQERVRQGELRWP